jgi:hypothetical protein
MQTYGSSRMTTVDRRRWLADRIRFLEGQLEGDVSDAQRTAIEAEIESLRNEAGPSRWWRRLLGIPGRPTDR